MTRKDSDFLFELRTLSSKSRITIQAFELTHKHTNNHLYFTVRVLENGEEVFAKGHLYAGVSIYAGHAIDSDAAKELAMSLVAMKPGDTDKEYFTGYTAKQLAFAEQHGEWLSYIAAERYGEP